MEIMSTSDSKVLISISISVEHTSSSALISQVRYSSSLLWSNCLFPHISHAMRAAVIGAGPAGFYTAQALLKKFPCCTVDLLEKLPVPFGLVRYGVAPDHPNTKNVINQFTQLANNNRNRFNFYGNISVSDTARNSHTSIPYQHLNSLYNLTIHASGAQKPRTLDLPLPATRVHTAHDFAYWINSHPHAFDNSAPTPVSEALSSSLRHATHVSIIGVGNVAIDVARILLQPLDSLRSTDISPSALDLLSMTNIKSVTLFARKSPANAAWTAPALREIVTKIPGITTMCDHSLIRRDLELPDIPRRSKSALKILAKSTKDEATHVPLPHEKILHLRFLNSPSSFDVDGETVSLKLHNNAGDDGVITDHANAVFLSLGYVGGSAPAPAVGWANDKASGIIADNKWDAESVVAALRHVDQNDMPLRPGIDEWIRSTDHSIVTWEGWQSIDAEERRLAESTLRPREKLHQVSDMLDVAHRSQLHSIPKSFKNNETRIDKDSLY